MKNEDAGIGEQQVAMDEFAAQVACLTACGQSCARRSSIPGEQTDW
jgi:hypothetical protein